MQELKKGVIQEIYCQEENDEQKSGSPHKISKKEDNTIKILDAEVKIIRRRQANWDQVEEYEKPIKEEITCGNKIDKNTFKLEIVRLKLERRPMLKMEESDPTHKSLHNIRDVKIKVVEEVEEENTRGQTYLNKLENLIQVDCEAMWEMPCLELKKCRYSSEIAGKAEMVEHKGWFFKVVSVQVVYVFFFTFIFILKLKDKFFEHDVVSIVYYSKINLIF